MNFWKKIKRLGHDLWPPCCDVSRSQSEQIDHSLSPVKRFGLWFHLIICKWCRRYGQHIRFLRMAAHAHEEKFTGVAPGRLSAAARDRIKEQLRGKA